MKSWPPWDALRRWKGWRRGKKNTLAAFFLTSRPTNGDDGGPKDDVEDKDDLDNQAQAGLKAKRVGQVSWALAVFLDKKVIL